MPGDVLLFGSQFTIFLLLKGPYGCYCQYINPYYLVNTGQVLDYLSRWSTLLFLLQPWCPSRCILRKSNLWPPQYLCTCHFHCLQSRSLNLHAGLLYIFFTSLHAWFLLRYLPWLCNPVLPSLFFVIFYFSHSWIYFRYMYWFTCLFCVFSH